MSDVSLEFIAAQLQRVLNEQAKMREDITELSAGQTVLTGLVLQQARDTVKIKDILGRIETRLTKVEAN